MTNIDISLNQSTTNRQPSQQNLKPGQKVYLYKDPEYTGILMRPVERTYPPLAHSFARSAFPCGLKIPRVPTADGGAGSLAKWTVALDGNGYEAVNVVDIHPLESSHSESKEAEIPFNDELENNPIPSQKVEREGEKIFQLEQQIIILKNTIRQLKAENQIIQQQYQELEQENQRLKEELKEAKNTIRRAKDISPLIRISLKRVLRLAHNACMDVKRTVGGWILKMGDKARIFRRLADIWDLLSQDDWYLSDLFAPDKLIPLAKIKPPRPSKRPIPPETEACPFFTPDEIIKRHNLDLPKDSKIA